MPPACLAWAQGKGPGGGRWALDMVSAVGFGAARTWGGAAGWVGWGHGWEGPHLWKTTASTVMAASRRKAKAPRMDPITKESLSGSWVDSSPEEAASQDHTWARRHKRAHLHPPHAPPHAHPQTQRPAGQPGDSPHSLLSHTASSLEGAGPGFKAWGVGPGPLLPTPRCSPSSSGLPLTLRQRLEIDLAAIGAVACGSPRPHLEAIDVARAQLCHGGRVGLAGQGEGVGLIFCLGVTAIHSLLPSASP